jgi:hypothetical protein
MVRAPRRFFDTVVWRQFSELHTDLWPYFEQTTERLIREAIHADTAALTRRQRSLDGRLYLIVRRACMRLSISLCPRYALRPVFER